MLSDSPIERAIHIDITLSYKLMKNQHFVSECGSSILIFSIRNHAQCVDTPSVSG